MNPSKHVLSIHAHIIAYSLVLGDSRREIAEAIWAELARILDCGEPLSEDDLRAICAACTILCTTLSRATNFTAGDAGRVLRDDRVRTMIARRNPEKRPGPVDTSYFLSVFATPAKGAAALLRELAEHLHGHDRDALLALAMYGHAGEVERIVVRALVGAAEVLNLGTR